MVISRNWGCFLDGVILQKEKRIGWKRREGGKNIPPPILFFYNCFHRTYFRTASAFRTFFFVDEIGFTFFDRFRGTFFCTGTTSYTFIGDHISHTPHPLYPYMKSGKILSGL
jgi:hypothetical protein